MFPVDQDVARAHMYERIEEARQLSRDRRLAMAARKARRAERAALQARLVPARSL